MTLEAQLEAHLRPLQPSERLRIERVVREFMRLSKAEQEWVMQTLALVAKSDDAPA